MRAPYFNEALDRQPDAGSEQFEFAIQDVTELLLSPRLTTETSNGNITVAMIRPNLTGSTLEEWSDMTAAQTLEANIMGLGMVTKFSVQFDREAIDAFYGGQPKDVQLGLPPERYTSYANRWDEFVDLMASGPSTVMLLHSPDGDAIQLWRKQVGHYDILKRRDPETLRGRFGRDNYNNLVHGSDSPKSAIREIKIIAAQLHRIMSE